MINLKLTSNEKEGLNEDEIEMAMVRKLEMLILPHLRRNLKFFYAGGNLKGKAEAYRSALDKDKLEKNLKSKTEKTIPAVCKPLCEMVSQILQGNGIDAETVCCDTDIFKHTDVLVTAKSGRKYIINYLEDIEIIQSGMKTPDFASKDYYERRYKKFENSTTTDGKKLDGISFFSSDRVNKIDSNLGYKKCNLYMDDVIEQIRAEFADFRNVQANNEIMEQHNCSAEMRENIYDKYNNMPKEEILEKKLDWIFNYFNDRMDINGHADFVMYYSRLLLKRVLSEKEYSSLSRYDCFAYNDKIPEDSLIKNILDLENPENESKSRFCMLEANDKLYIFSTKANEYVKLEKDDFDKINEYVNLSKSEKPSDLMLYLCDRGNALPLVFHPLGSKILNERAQLIDENLDVSERKKAIKELSDNIKTTDEPITSISIPYEDGKIKYLYINENDEFVIKEENKETIYHYNEVDDTFSTEECEISGNNEGR